LKKAGHNTNVGDEGGFAPNLPSAEAALDFCRKAIADAGFKPGEDIALGVDCAATEFFMVATMCMRAKANAPAAGAGAISGKASHGVSHRLDRRRDVGG